MSKYLLFLTKFQKSPSAIHSQAPLIFDNQKTF